MRGAAGGLALADEAGVVGAQGGVHDIVGDVGPHLHCTAPLAAEVPPQDGAAVDKPEVALAARHARSAAPTTMND